VAEETGLDVVPQRLLYVAEVVGSYGTHDLNLVWLAELVDSAGAIDDDALVAFDSPLAQSIMPPIVKQIAADAKSGWSGRDGSGTFAAAPGVESRSPTSFESRPPLAGRVARRTQARRRSTATSASRVASSACGSTWVSASTGIKFVSPSQRGTTCIAGAV
jgi:hypothetical protein